MRSENNMEIAAIACALLTGLMLFVWGVVLSDTIPVEYRSASPGFGWAWDFDYQSGMAEAGRFGEAPRPWPAKDSGDHILLPLNQALTSRGLKLTYQGLLESDRFRLDIGIERLDASVTYPQEFAVPEVGRGLIIDDRRFVLEKITPHYLRLRTPDE